MWKRLDSNRLLPQLNLRNNQGTGFVWGKDVIWCVCTCFLKQSTFLNFPWSQVQLHSHLPRSKPCNCLFCVRANGSASITAADHQVWSPRTTGQEDDETSCLAPRDRLAIPCNAWEWVRTTWSSVSLTQQCIFERGSLPRIPQAKREGNRFPEKKLRLTVEGCWSKSWAVVHPTPQWPTIWRTACSGAAVCLTRAACVWMQWLLWPWDGCYSGWRLLLPEKKNQKNFGPSACQVKPLQIHAHKFSLEG